MLYKYVPCWCLGTQEEWTEYEVYQETFKAVFDKHNDEKNNPETCIHLLLR